MGKLKNKIEDSRVALVHALVLAATATTEENSKKCEKMALDIIRSIGDKSVIDLCYKKAEEILQD